MRICHLINSLGSGGAERNLTELVNNIKGYENIIISLKKDNFYSKQINKNCKIYFLNFSYSLASIFEFFKIIKILNSEKPKIMMAWMYHSIFLTIFIKLFINCRVIWNIRHSNFNIKYTKIKTIIFVLFCSIFSYVIPKKIVYNSSTSKVFHEKKFYSKKKSVLINNGFHKFYNKKIKNKKFIISMVGRNNPQKNHSTFFKAISKLPKNLNLAFILIGKDIPFLKKKYIKIYRKELFKKIYFYNEKKNIFNFYKLIDLNILPSIYGESFPNVIAETMSFGIPNIASNIGDAKKIVGKNGIILSNPNSSKELSHKILKMYKIWNNKKRWEFIQKKCSHHIKKKYNLLKTIKKYKELFDRL